MEKAKYQWQKLESLQTKKWRPSTFMGEENWCCKCQYYRKELIDSTQSLSKYQWHGNRKQYLRFVWTHQRPLMEKVKSRAIETKPNSFITWLQTTLKKKKKKCSKPNSKTKLSSRCPDIANGVFPLRAALTCKLKEIITYICFQEISLSTEWINQLGFRILSLTNIYWK